MSSLAADLYANVCTREIAELGVADALTDEPESAAELAGKVGADPGSAIKHPTA